MVRESTAERARRLQGMAVEHVGSPARLLAGPGTGKTESMTQRVIRLTQDPHVLPTNILALTFTRAAAQELRARVRAAIDADEVTPRVQTLHAFALSQLLANRDKVTSLPQPLRIADDWEEKNIIDPDLRERLDVRIEKVRERFRALASEWETLRADATGWEQEFPDGEFLGAWREHRAVFAYTLRSELVYQLKKALEQRGDMAVPSPQHLLIDEFQDLNPCDLAVISWLEEAGAELYAAGDDDQSIYGFRNAAPIAIRTFSDDRQPSVDLRLEVCWRCDPEILRVASFVISQDVDRISKILVAVDGRPAGVVEIHNFGGQVAEAKWIAAKCADLIADGVPRRQILLLLRSDRTRMFSKVLAAHLAAVGVESHVDVGEEGPLDAIGGRQTFALLRLAVSGFDSLAWRTLQSLDRNGLGAGATRALYACAQNDATTYAAVIRANRDTDQLGSWSARVRTWTEGVIRDVEGLIVALNVGDLPPDERGPALRLQLSSIPVSERVDVQMEFQEAIDHLGHIAEETEASDLEALVRAIGATRDEDEPVVSEEAVNILSMHKAKGLGRDVVFVVAAEQEMIPGYATTKAQRDDERRLLYVSLSRARHQLFITHCDRRVGQQARAGRVSGRFRSLTEFLRDSRTTSVQHKAARRAPRRPPRPRPSRVPS